LLELATKDMYNAKLRDWHYRGCGFLGFS